MKWKVVAGGAVVVLLLAVGSTISLVGGEAKANVCIKGAPVAGPGPGKGGDGVGSSAARDRNLVTIAGVGKAMRVPTRGIEVAYAVVLVESGGLNLASHAVPESLKYPHDTNRLAYPPSGTPSGDHDSINPFQQRVSMGWFPNVREGMKVPVAARSFFAALKRVKGWERMKFTDAAQAVQRSAYGSRYGQRETEAKKLVAELASGATAPDEPQKECTKPEKPVVAGAKGNPVVSGKWANPVAPVKYRIMSHYGPRIMFGSFFHKGEDLGAPMGTPVRSVCDGVIIGAKWVLGGGGNEVKTDCGGGVTVKLMHNSKIDVKIGQRVKAGQVVAKMGSTGNSTGPHSHVQIEIRGKHTAPIPFLDKLGVKL